jgi:hypothetical protein
MARTKGKILNERTVTVKHEDCRVLVSWDGKVQYSTVQDGWLAENSAIREAYRMLIDTEGCWVEIWPAPFTPCGGGEYTVRLRVAPWT